MLKLVDRPDLGSGVERRVGSSPTTRTGACVNDRHGSFFVFFLLKFGT